MEPLAARVYADFDAVTVRELNYVPLIFTDRRMRELFADWTAVARACVAILRRARTGQEGGPGGRGGGSRRTRGAGRRGEPWRSCRHGRRGPCP
ncbi:MmyB family transcriptional regulator [Pseudonocardia terrae]|uniref:MmyB family transcriptional regulator n=1 Tax=Pseudonocardia terrae TaxID=2905831 RepID=UPI003558BB27